MQRLPENFLLLHTGEESLREKSIEAILASKHLQDQVMTIESAIDAINYFSTKRVHKNDSEMTIQLLGLRLFNASASSFKLMMSGYYQNSALMMRDILETAFLLDYFHTHPHQISKWKISTEEERNKNFSPVKIRMELDARDGFHKEKRKDVYKLLCKLAAHPAYEGFAMLTPLDGGLAHCGPFFADSHLLACVNELVKLISQATTHLLKFFPAENELDKKQAEAFYSQNIAWAAKYMGYTPQIK